VVDAKNREKLENTAGIIAEELNVKTVEFCEDVEALVKRSCKANFKTLGKKLGKNMKEAAAMIEQFTGSEIGAIVDGTPAKLTLADGSVAEVTAEDLVVKHEQKAGMVAASEAGVTIALATELTRELEEEGFAREFISKIQAIRKDMDLDVADRIKVTCEVTADWQSALSNFKDYICGETLTVELTFGSAETAVDVNGIECKVTVAKA
jgi:isoleucyl-tRNA synthetase